MSDNRIAQIVSDRTTGYVYATMYRGGLFRLTGPLSSVPGDVAAPQVPVRREGSDFVFDGDGVLVIYNMLGQPVAHQSGPRWNSDGMAAGVYLYTIERAGVIHSGKVVVGW